MSFWKEDSTYPSKRFFGGFFGSAVRMIAGPPLSADALDITFNRPFWSCFRDLLWQTTKRDFSGSLSPFVSSWVSCRNCEEDLSMLPIRVDVPTSHARDPVCLETAHQNPASKNVKSYLERKPPSSVFRHSVDRHRPQCPRQRHASLPFRSFTFIGVYCVCWLFTFP